jgi:hypothetical protein
MWMVAEQLKTRLSSASGAAAVAGLHQFRETNLTELRAI